VKKRLSAITRKGLSFALFLIFMGVIGAMAILGTDGSIVIYTVTHSLVAWGELIGLGLALAVVKMFGGKALGLK